MAKKKTGRTNDGRTIRHSGYQMSQRIRKRIEEIFGWTKEFGGMRKVKVRGIPKISFHFTLALAAFNLVRLRRLLAAGT